MQTRQLPETTGGGLRSLAFNSDETHPYDLREIINAILYIGYRLPMERTSAISRNGRCILLFQQI